MSAFPYSQTSPPPTAGPLPVIERANLNTPYSGGGGGGGGGPNPVFSTITTQLDAVIGGSISGYGLTLNGSGPYAGQNTTFAPQNGGVVSISNGINTPSVIAQSISNSTNPVSISSLTVSSINGAAPGGGGGGIPAAGISTNQVASVASTLSLLANENTNITLDDTKTAAVVISSKGGGGNIELNAYSTIITYDLNVSSINGAAPGGGGGPTPALVASSLTISTITTAEPITTNIVMYGRGGQNVTYNMTDVGLNEIRIDNTGIIGAIGVQGTSIYVGPRFNDPVDIPVTISTLLCSTINGVVPGGGGAGPDLALSTLTMGIPGGISGVSSIGGVGGSLPIVGGISVSSISVSSINGAAPGGGGALQFSSIGVPGGGGLSSFTCDPGFNNPIVEFSTITGHTYSATAFARAETTEIGATGDQLVYEFLSGGVAQPLGSWPNESISTTTGGGNLQYICGTANWKATGTGTAFNIVPAQSSFVRVDAINVIDFGAI